MAFLLNLFLNLCKKIVLKLLLFSILILVSSVLFGQKDLRKELDVLKNIIRQSSYYDSSQVFTNGQKAIAIAQKLKNSSEEATIYQYYGNFYYFSYNIPKAKANYAKSIEIAQKANNNKLINSTKIRLAFVLSDSDLLAAEKEFQKLLLEALKNNYLENSIEIYNGLGNIYDTRQMKDEALNFYLKGLKISEKSNKKYLNAMLLNNIGLIKLDNEQTSEAEKDFVQGLKIIQGLNEDRLSLNLNNNLGLVTKKLKKYDKSIKYYHNTLLNAKKLGFPIARGVAFLNLSDSYLQNKEYAKAQSYADSSLQIMGSFEQWDYLGTGYLIKASAYKEMGNNQLAKTYIDSVFNLNKQHKISNAVMMANDQLGAIYESEGDFKLAFFHSNRYHQMNDSISKLANKDQFAQLQVIYGKEKTETALEDEKNRNTILSKENEIKQTKIQAIILITIFILLIGIGLVYIRYVRLSKQQQKQFTQKLIESIDNERSRISKDLHDDIGQSLSAIKSKLNLLNTGKIKDVAGLDIEVGEIIDHTRNISHSLHPSLLQKLGLERSLVSLTEKTQSNSQIVCSLDIRCSLDRLTLENQTQIYRILQECINNTLKHSDASALKVSIKELSNDLIIKYQDNGKGIDDSQKQHAGIGMMTIQERAHTLNANISIISSKNKGFKFILTVPKNKII